uniref:glutathione S-transferase C-terminal domain-containing protein n=1 Tax=Methylobacterium nigriterrae TaxID=3127512 RepID=UPI003013713D
DYVVGTLHGQAFGRIFKPPKFEPPDIVHQTRGGGQHATERKGHEMVEEALSILERQLAGRDYVTGAQFTIADSALFYAERWAPQVKIALPP